jgi:hypothetical protein
MESVVGARMTHDCPVALCVDLAAPVRPAKPVDPGYDIVNTIVSAIVEGL